MGGFMGLLLGASVMTLCELFDLVLYNCFRKLHNRRKISVINIKEAPAWMIWHHICALMRKRRNSIANTLELRLFCIKSLIWNAKVCCLTAI